MSSERSVITTCPSHAHRHSPDNSDQMLSSLGQSSENKKCIDKSYNSTLVKSTRETGVAEETIPFLPRKNINIANSEKCFPRAGDYSEVATSDVSNASSVSRASLCDQAARVTRVKKVAASQYCDKPSSLASLSSPIIDGAFTTHCPYPLYPPSLSSSSSSSPSSSCPPSPSAEEARRLLSRIHRPEVAESSTWV